MQFLGWYTDSPDTIFYLTISKKYANGNFYSAINNYWSPLISWFLIPFHLCGTDPLIAFKTLQLISGGTALLLTIKLSRKFLKSKPVLTFFALACIPVFLSYALLYQTPDLLFLCFLLLLLLQIMHLLSAQTNKPFKYGIWLGITGGLLYLSKAFGFPFFISAILLLLIFNYFKIKEKKQREFIYLTSFSACITFFVISLSWMYCLKVKYGTFTTGYAHVYNFNLLHPEIYTPGITKLQHPVLVNGLMDITSREEASAWESPGVSQQRSWNPIERKDYFIHYLNIIKSNVVSFYYFIIKRNIGALFRN